MSGPRPSILSDEERAHIRSSNMEYLNLTDEQYDRHQELMQAKMSEWPDPLWQYVKEVGSHVGICGEVISSSVADWVRETPEHTQIDPGPYLER